MLETLLVRELLGGVDVPERDGADDAVGEGEDVVVEDDGGLGRGGAVEVGDEPVHLLLARVAGGLDAAHAEELEREELAHLAPVLAVGREGDVVEVVGEALGPRRRGAAAAVDVVHLEHLTGRLRAGHHHRRHRA